MNPGVPSSEQKILQKSVEIYAPASRVWQALTIPSSMKKWMMPDLELEIHTDWMVGSPLLMRRNMNGKYFENRRMVLQYEPDKHLQYSHLSRSRSFPIGRKVIPFWILSYSP